MKITVNDQHMEFEPPLSIATLLERLECHQPGSALAVNQIIIPRTDWATHYVQNGDDILLFHAIAGG